MCHYNLNGTPCCFSYSEDIIHGIMRHDSKLHKGEKIQSPRGHAVLTMLWRLIIVKNI